MDQQDPSAPSQAVIFDTDVLIERFRGSEKAETFVRTCPPVLRKISAVAYMELLQGASAPRELRTIRQYIEKNFSEVVPLTEKTTHQAIRLIERHALPHGLRVADALIAATALVHSFHLATANERHYRPIKGLKLKVYRSEGPSVEST